MTGDFAALDALVKKLKALPEDIRRELAPVLKLELLHQVQECFANDRDPYGEPWAPLKHRSGEILRDTRALANSFTCTDVFPLQLGTNVPYAPFHQDGTPTIPRRRMVPEPNDLPPLWATALTKTTDLVIAALAKGFPS